MIMSSTHLNMAWRNEVIYHILIDRFAGYDPHKNPLKPDYIGGNITGIIENLDYIQDLGATCIYLSPFLKGTGYHGYDTTDFFSVDEHFGTLEQLQELASQVHNRGMKLMIDFAANHCSPQHPYFIDATTDPNSKYRDWFTFRHWPDDYLCWLDKLSADKVPKINLENREAREHIIGAALHWTQALDVDALRLDHVIGPPNNFWREFRQRIKGARPDIFLLAEVLLLGIDLRKSYRGALNLPVPAKALLRLSLVEQLEAIFTAYESTFDGYIDFPFYELMNGYIRGQISVEHVSKELRGHYAHMSANLALATLLDNHDVDRVLFVAENHLERVLTAITLQAEQRQPMFIYYGTELGMSQVQANIATPDKLIDVNGRMPMPLLADRDLTNPIYRRYHKVLADRAKR
jgi:cyclomaltodextrinase